jgi:hypothetical protein
VLKIVAELGVLRGRLSTIVVFYFIELIVICLASLINVPLCLPRGDRLLACGRWDKVLGLRGCCQPDLNLLSGDARFRYKPALPT